MKAEVMAKTTKTMMKAEAMAEVEAVAEMKVIF
jgi:hypothetical protein